MSKQNQDILLWLYTGIIIILLAFFTWTGFRLADTNKELALCRVGNPLKINVICRYDNPNVSYVINRTYVFPDYKTQQHFIEEHKEDWQYCEVVT